MPITSYDFEQLKSLIKAEFSRRNGNGSLVPYTGIDYDFNNKPIVNGPILVEHGEKTVNLLLDVVNIDNFSKVQYGSIVKDPNDLYTKLNDMKSKPMTSAISDCKSLCSGLCVSTCTGTCTGSCLGSCSGCSGTCEGWCTGCSGSCGSCGGDCEGFCDGSCAYDCGNTCVGCSNGCSVSCRWQTQ